MRHLFCLIVAALVSSGCGSAAGTALRPATDPQIATAEALIDAFYSFDPVRLKAALASAPESFPVIGFYQGWAEGGNYRIVERKPCTMKSADEASCSITVKDDLIGALGLAMNVTDTFHVKFSEGKIVRVKTSSNDPEMFNEALEWVKRERSALVDEPCQGFFNGGPTPGKCVQAVVQGFREFAARQGK